MKYADRTKCYFCRSCNQEVSPVFKDTSKSSQHYGAVFCPICQGWLDWVGKPENQDKRTKTSKFTLADVGLEYCEWCGRTKDELGTRETFHLHHKKPLEEDGPDELWNIMVVCTACHKQAEWTRTYLHRHLDDFYTFYERDRKPTS